MNTLMMILLGALALMSVGLLKSYRHISDRELKRRAREGDQIAAALYKAVAYGPSLGAVLWLLVVLTNALFFVNVARSAPTWFAVMASASLLWFAFIWMPARDVTRFSTWVAVQLAPVFAFLLSFVHPLIDRVVSFVNKHRPVSIHTGIYDKTDLITLIQDQQVQPGNRIEKVELETALHALTFGDLTVREVMIPRRAVKMVSAKELVGPVLLSELHKSGFSRFPVYEGKKDNIVGVLHMRDTTTAKTGGSIEKLMSIQLAYIHEEQSLADALQAILKTHRQQYVVVNSFEEYVGIITIEDVLEQIVGKPIVDEFDQYDDIRAVAARAARKEHDEHIQAHREEPHHEVGVPEQPKEDAEKESKA
jgi:CBS domain containing-hemolysin-like protein